MSSRLNQIDYTKDDLKHYFYHLGYSREKIEKMIKDIKGERKNSTYY